ncbi:MAG: hypothetical protein AAF658_10440 [Myxococcota bacterium]
MKEESSKATIERAKLQAKGRAESGASNRAANPTPDLDSAIVDEQRRALAERWESRKRKKRGGSVVRKLATLVVFLIALSAGAGALIYYEGPWTPQVNSLMNRSEAVQTIDRTVATVRRQLGL